MYQRNYKQWKRIDPKMGFMKKQGVRLRLPS